MPEPIDHHMTALQLPDECAASKWSYRRRQSANKEVVPFLQFLSTMVFWERVEYAIRIAFVGVLPTAILAFHPDTTKTWLLPSVMLTYCIVASQNSVALAIEHFVQITRSLVLAVVVSEISLAIDPARHWVGWGVLFCGVIILIALFTNGLVTKLGLFGWSIFMVLQYKHETLTHNKYSGPPEYFKQCIVATSFGLLTSLFPYPYFETWKAQKLEKKVLELLAQQFHGLTESAYTNNLQRSASLVHVRQLHREIEETTVALHKALELAHVEVWFSARRHAMHNRLGLIMRLIRNADAALEALEFGNRHRHEWDDNEYHQRFGQAMLGPLRAAAVKFEWFLSRVSQTEVVSDDMLDEMRRVSANLDQQFMAARKDVIFPLLDSVADSRPFQAFPFLSVNSFLFPWKDSVDALGTFATTAPPPAHLALSHVLLFPLRDLQEFWRSVVGLVRMETGMMIRLRDALKLAFAMTTAVALLLNRKTQDPAGGAAVIGFLMDADPSNNVTTGIKFLIGCVFGSVFGLLCNSVSENLTQTIIWMVVITLVTGFGKSGPKWGETMFFVMFFGLGAMVPGATDLKLIKSMQQDVVSICWLVFVSNFFWPTYPSTKLHISIESSISESRKFLVLFLKSFGPTGAGAWNHEALFEQMHKVRVMAIGQHGLVEAAGEEPSIRVDAFPYDVYRSYTANLRHFIAHFAPLLTAGDFIAHSPDRLHFFKKVEATVSDLADAVNTLMRMLEELVEVKAQTAWGGGSQSGTAASRPVDDVLAQMSAVRVLAEKVVRGAELGFMEQWEMIKNGTHRTPEPYEIPACHMVLGSVERLPVELYDLVLAVIAVRDIQ